MQRAGERGGDTGIPHGTEWGIEGQFQMKKRSAAIHAGNIWYTRSTGGLVIVKGEGHVWEHHPAPNWSFREENKMRKRSGSSSPDSSPDGGKRRRLERETSLPTEGQVGPSLDMLQVQFMENRARVQRGDSSRLAGSSDGEDSRSGSKSPSGDLAPIEREHQVGSKRSDSHSSPGYETHEPQQLSEFAGLSGHEAEGRPETPKGEQPLANEGLQRDLEVEDERMGISGSVAELEGVNRRRAALESRFQDLTTQARDRSSLGQDRIRVWVAVDYDNAGRRVIADQQRADTAALFIGHLEASEEASDNFKRESRVIDNTRAYEELLSRWEHDTETRAANQMQGWTNLENGQNVQRNNFAP